MPTNPETRFRFAERLAHSLTCQYTEGFFLGGSTATGTTTPYSDLDLAHVVGEEYEGLVKKSYYDGDLLAGETSVPSDASHASGLTTTRRNSSA